MALTWEKIPVSRFEPGNSLFKKDTTGYKEIEKDYVYNAKRIWGIKHDEKKRWDKEFNQALKDVPTGSAIYVPGGKIHFEVPLEIRRNVSIVGDSGNTFFIGAKGQGIIYIGQDAAGAVFKNFTVTHDSIDEKDGLQEDGKYSNDFTKYSVGLMVQGVVDIENVTGWRLSGNAFYFFGMIGNGVHTNVSNAVVRRCYAIECKANAFVVDGPDANYINFENLTASDNGLAAFRDSSFLGTTVKGLMSHNNKGGAVITGGEELNQRTHIYGVYEENGSTPSYLGRGTFVSGFLSNGFTGEGMYQEGGRFYGQMEWGDMKLTENALHFGNNVLRKREGGVWGSAYNDIPANVSWGFCDDGATIKASRDTNAFPEGRTVNHGGFVADIMYLGGRRRGAINSRYFLKEMAYQFEKGDYFDNSGPDGRNPIKWVCIQAGWGDNAVFKAYGNGAGLLRDAPIGNLYGQDAGWKYYATDEKKEYIWTGSELV